MKTALCFALLAVPALALAAPKSKPAAKPKETPAKTDRGAAKDITGNYEMQGSSSGDRYDMDVAQGDGGLTVEFRGAFGISTHTCDCNMVGTPAGEEKWTLSGDAKGSIGVFGEKLIVDIERPAECCGADFPGAPDFKIAGARKPTLCTVKAAKAAIHGADGVATSHTVSKGEKVEAFVTGEDDPADLVVARTAGKKHTQAFFAAGDLDCPKPAPKATAKPAATEGAAAPDVTPAGESTPGATP